MAQLAIKGHAARGKEVIEILKMLGGQNYSHDFLGKTEYNYYYIGNYSTISCIPKEKLNDSFITFTLEEFLEKFPYKVGDKVLLSGVVKIINQTCWDDINDEVIYKLETNIRGFSEEYYVHHYNLQPYKEETMEIPEKLMPKIDFNEYCKDKYILDLGNYEIKEENGKTYAVRKQIEYPKTYEKCCEVLGLNNSEIKIKVLIHNTEHGEAELYRKFIELKRCRDAYWKLAGEQMGLGKPWKPDFKDDSDKYFICYVKDEVWKSNIRDCNKVLVFPTAKMRDAFYENFKDLIEECKELL